MYKKIKNNLSVLMLMIVLITSSNLVSAEEMIIKDIDLSSEYAKESIINLANLGIVDGNQSGNFNPHNTITRGEMTKMIVEALGIDTSEVTDTETFSDVTKDHWAFKYIETAFKEGLIKGYSQDEFGINDKLTREQMGVIFVRALNLKNYEESISDFINISKLNDKNDISSWAKSDIEVAIGSNLLKGIGNDTFSPKGSAKREQVAVVTDRFIKNKSNILKEYNDIIVNFNDDRVKLDSDILVENDVTLVPLSFFDKYVLNSLASSYSSENNIIFIERPSTESREYKSVVLKIDDINAFINTPNYSFENIDTENENLISLDIEPRMINDVVYVPFKQLSELLGLEYNFDAESNIITLTDSSINSTPNLYYTLKKNAYLPFKGELYSTMNFDLVGRDSGEYMNLNLYMNTLVNGYEAHSQGEMNISSNDFNKETFIESIVVDGYLYELDYENELWNQYELEIPDSELEGKAIDIDFYNNYDSYPVKFEKREKINEEYTNKYSITLTGEEMLDLIPEENYYLLENILTDTNMEFDNYIIYIYVNNNNEIVKQQFILNGIINDPTEVIDYDMTIDMEYNNIGTEYDIVAPF